MKNRRIRIEFKIGLIGFVSMLTISLLKEISLWESLQRAMGGFIFFLIWSIIIKIVILRCKLKGDNSTS